jgi:hypothetical protein
VDRLNSEGIRRQDLSFTLKNPLKVRDARRIDACLLCRRPRVNEAGLCDVCYASLEDDELYLATCWLRGTAP